MIKLRKATFDDWARLYHWRNDKRTRESFIQPDPVPLDQHLAWLKRTLADSESLVYVARDTLGPVVGTCRLKRVAEKKDRFVDCSIALDPAHRGRGLATSVLEVLVIEYRRLLDSEWQKAGYLRARVRTENYASLRAFASTGFVVVDVKDDIAVLRLPS